MKRNTNKNMKAAIKYGCTVGLGFGVIAVRVGVVAYTWTQIAPWLGGMLLGLQIASVWRAVVAQADRQARR